MEPVYRSVIGLLVSGFAVQRWTVTTTGGEHVPVTGPAILATNHIGYIDFVVVGYSVREVTPTKRLVRFAAKKEVFDHGLAGPLMRAMKHIPVDRVAAPTDAIHHAVGLLEQGELVGMFPEATISRSFVPLRGKTGAVRMAMAAGVPIVPGAVWGTQRLFTKGRDHAFTTRHVPITVDWAPPMAVEPDEDPQAATDRLMAVIDELVDAAARRYPVDPEPGDEWWQPAHLDGSAPTPAEATAIAREEAAARRARRRQLRAEEG